MARRTSLPKELMLFIKQHKAWVLAPIIAILLLLIALVALGSTAAAPFIYALF